MKKSVVFLCLISILLTGCRENYLAEKQFYKAQKILEQTSRVDGKDAILPAIDAFQEVVRKFPTTPKAAESLVVISNMWSYLKNYEEARNSLRSLVQNFSHLKHQAAEARYRIAQTYEIEKRWENAEKAYWELAEYHPFHIRGFSAPVYIVTYHAQYGNEVALSRAYNKALDHFEGLIKHLGAIQQSATPRNYLALTHMAYGKWQEAIDQWIAIADQFPDTPQAPMALLGAAELASRYSDFDQAMVLYGRYFKDYPDHNLITKTRVNVGMMFNSKKDFATAREWFMRAANDIRAQDEQTPSVRAALADVQLLTAKTYADEGDAENAEKIYTEIVNQYPLTSGALQVPLLRSRQAAAAGDTELKNAILDEAVAQYKAIEEEHAGQDIARVAERFLASALTEKGDWQTLLATVDQYLAQEVLPDKKGRWMFLKALITHNRLKDDIAAKDLFQKFLAQYPDHRLAAVAKTALENIASAKSV